MEALLDVILPVFLVVGCGYIVVWRNVFSTAAVDGLMSYTQNFAIPCLLFMALIKIDLGQAYSFRLMGSYYIGAASGFALGFLGARYIFKRSAEDSVAIGFVSLFSNSVMMGLAITERAYGIDALVANFAIVSLHAPFCYFVGITAMEIAKSDGDSIVQVAMNVGKSMMKNALFVAIFLGLLVNFSGIALPKALLDGTNMWRQPPCPPHCLAWEVFYINIAPKEILARSPGSLEFPYWCILQSYGALDNTGFLAFPSFDLPC